MQKPRHFAKMCRLQIPPLPKNRGQFTHRQQTQTRNVKTINESATQEIAPPLEENYEIETIDPEPTMYITELMGYWNKISLVKRDFKNTKIQN